MATSLLTTDMDVQKRGYECDFVQPPPSYLETECSICLLVLRTPQLVSCCGHNFCKKCIDAVRKEENGCPLCKAKDFTVVYNRAYDVALKQLEVYCPNHKMGCRWQGRIKKLDEHLNIDPDLDEQLKGCIYVEVECSHDGCEQSLQRHLIASHQNNECSLRPFACVHCNNYTTTYDNVTTTHWEVCECYPVSCPNACSEDTIERKNLEKHLNEDCPLQEVECEFAGCEAKLPRKDMPEHIGNMEGMSRHILLLARQNRRLSQQNHHLEEELKKQVEKQNQRSSEDKQELNRTIRNLEQKNEELVKQVQQLKFRVGDIAPVSITMTDFNRHKQQSDKWYSEGFYTHPRGYKLCLRVDANGEGDGKCTHVSCYVYIMCGEFDNNLDWPFKGVITIRLLNQREDTAHCVQTLDFTQLHIPSGSKSRVYFGNMTSSGLGYPQFIHHNDLGYRWQNNCQYLMNDCLCFQLEIKLA